jgi:hypothetical protein
LATSTVSKSLDGKMAGTFQNNGESRRRVSKMQMSRFDVCFRFFFHTRDEVGSAVSVTHELCHCQSKPFGVGVGERRVLTRIYISRMPDWMMQHCPTGMPWTAASCTSTPKNGADQIESQMLGHCSAISKQDESDSNM